MFFAMLRCPNEHLDQIVVQAVEDLSLEGPLELRVIEIARVQLEVIGVNRWIREARPDDDLDRFAFIARIELDEWMLVEPKLL